MANQSCAGENFQDKQEKDKDNGYITVSIFCASNFWEAL